MIQIFKIKKKSNITVKNTIKKLFTLSVTK